MNMFHRNMFHYIAAHPPLMNINEHKLSLWVLATVITCICWLNHMASLLSEFYSPPKTVVHSEIVLRFYSNFCKSVHSTLKLS